MFEGGINYMFFFCSYGVIGDVEEKYNLKGLFFFLLIWKMKEGVWEICMNLWGIVEEKMESLSVKKIERVVLEIIEELF